MKIVALGGGLANQMYQYVLYKGLELYSDDICFLDDSAFLRYNFHNGLELDKAFDIAPRWFRDQFTDSEWLELSGIMGTYPFLERARLLGLDINVMSFRSRFEFFNKLYNLVEHPRGKCGIWERPAFGVESHLFQMARLKGHFYFHDVWVSTFFKDVRDEVLRDFTFRPFDDEKNRRMSEHIGRTNSVALHVRRGDFVAINWHSSAQVYGSAVNKMKCAVINPTFFIFSDDIPWCRENLADMALGGRDDVVIVDINRGEKSFRDMQLMSMCKHLIQAPRSTFSQMAGLLNRNPDKIIEYPQL